MVYSSLTLSWVSQNVTVMYFTLPDLCCVNHQRQDAQSVVRVSQGRYPFTLKLSKSEGGVGNDPSQ